MLEQKIFHQRCQEKYINEDKLNSRFTKHNHTSADGAETSLTTKPDEFFVAGAFLIIIAQSEVPPSSRSEKLAAFCSSCFWK